VDINIISTESLGTRGMCCSVKAGKRCILIDPGIALGYLRGGLLPHPFQVAIGALIREKIICACSNATDIVFSHYHGDHIPLYNANPYQLSLERVREILPQKRLWGLNPENVSETMQLRAQAIGGYLGFKIPAAEGVHDGELCFSQAMPHGELGKNRNRVMMTRIDADGCVFVHASDIQLTERFPVSQILEWKPDIAFASGPPLYLNRMSPASRKNARENTLILSDRVDTLIIDHHVLRSKDSIAWFNDIRKTAKNRILCAADFMKKKRCFLEAQRPALYKDMPVPEDWHENHAQGNAEFSGYLVWRNRDISHEVVKMFKNGQDHPNPPLKPGVAN